MAFCQNTEISRHTSILFTAHSLGNPGLEFCLPPTNIKREEVFAEFEILFARLLHHKPKSIDELSLLKAKLNELAHSFCGSPIDVTKFPFDSDCLQAIKSLRSNKHILITKPDKGSGVVILNRSEYDKKNGNHPF